MNPGSVEVRSWRKSGARVQAIRIRIRLFTRIAYGFRSAEVLVATALAGRPWTLPIVTGQASPLAHHGPVIYHGQAV